MEIDMSDIFAGISCLIALVALVQSVVSGRKVKDLDLQLKQKELELHNENEADAKKADVEVNMIETAGRKLNILRFYNKGKADAYNVSFEIVSDKDDNDIILHMDKALLPYPKLLPFQNFEVPFLNNGYKPYQTILITWDDESGKGRTKEIVIMVD